MFETTDKMFIIHLVLTAVYIRAFSVLQMFRLIGTPMFFLTSDSSRDYYNIVRLEKNKHVEFGGRFVFKFRHCYLLANWLLDVFFILSEAEVSSVNWNSGT